MSILRQLGHTCPDNGMDRLLYPRGGIVCEDYTTTPGEVSAGSARLLPQGAGVY
jgi:hypothetical protein